MAAFFYIIYIIRKFTIQALSAHKNLTQSDCNHCDETIPARDIPNQVNGIPNTAPKNHNIHDPHSSIIVCVYSILHKVWNIVPYKGRGQKIPNFGHEPL